MPTSLPARAVEPRSDILGWLVCSLPLASVLLVILLNFAAGHGLGHLFRVYGCTLKYAVG